MHPRQLHDVADLQRHEALVARRRIRRRPLRTGRRRRGGGRDARRRAPPATPAPPTRGRRAAPTGADGFRRLWLSAGVSNLADGILFAGLPVLATRVTDSPALIAGVAVALMLPMALTALPAGVVADRFDRRRVLVAANLVRVVGITAVLAAVVAGELRLAAIYAVAAIAGGSEVLVDTTAQTTVPALVPEHELAGANARLGGTQVVMNDAVGAPIGSFLAGIGAGAAFGVPALSFAVAALLVRRLPRHEPRPPAARRSATLGELRTDVRDGVRYLADHPVLRRLALAGAASNLGNTAFFAVLVVLVVGPLELPTPAYGWFLAAVALGGLLGSVVAGRVLRSLGHATTIKLAGAVAVVGYLVATVTRHWPVLAVALTALGAIGMIWNVASRVLRQTIVPDRLLGRVTSSMALVALVSTPVGGLLGGVVAEVVGVRGAGGVAVAANLLALTLLAPISRAAVEAARADARGRMAAGQRPLERG